VPSELVDALKGALSTLKTTYTTDTTEKVLEVQADGTRLVESLSVTTTKVEPSQPTPTTPPLKFRTVTAYRSNGSVDVTELKYDTSGLDQASAKALEATSANVRAALQDGLHSIYGVPYEIGKAVTLTSNASAALSTLGLTGTGLNSSEVRTLTGRGTSGQYQFSSTYAVVPGQASSSTGEVGIGMVIESASGTGTSSYLADGRPERSQSTIVQQGGLRLQLPAQNGLEYVINTRFESTTRSTLTVQP
jgi:hypothetical protein